MNPQARIAQIRHVGASSMFNFFSSRTGAAQAPNPQEAVQAVVAKRALVIDVREEGEFHGGHARGGINLPLSRLHLTADPNSGHFDKRLAAARKAGTPLYLYCASGARSGRAAGMLQQFGFDDVQNLGTLHAWVQGGGDVAR